MQVLQVHVGRDHLEVEQDGVLRPGDGAAAGEAGVGQGAAGETEHRAVAPEAHPAHRVAQGDGGRIVISSSVTGSRAIQNLSAYAVTKAALQHMATVLALELGPHGITVNAISIGATVNERNLTDDPEYAEHWAEVLPTGRVGHPEDVAAALSYLVSPEAAMVTGHTLTVDFGWTGMGLTP